MPAIVAEEERCHTSFPITASITENATESPGELRERLMGLAGYLLENGPVIEDGHTIGQDANEKITVAFGDSPFGHEGEVMRLDYSSKKKKRGWFRRR